MIFQISYSPKATYDWGKLKLAVQGRDLLYAMKERGVDWSDENEVENYIRDAFNMTQVRYRLELFGAPKELISVGCLCDGSAGCMSFCNDDVEPALPGPGILSFNGMPTDFTVTQTDTISHIYDVIVTNQPLTGLETQIANYLNDNRGFVLVRNLGGGDFDDYGGILNRFFAVEESVSGSGAIEFNLRDLDERPDYSPIPKYFSHMPNGTGNFYNIAHVFEAFSSDMVKEPSIDGLMILETSDGSPACVAKFGAFNGQGRTAWLSGGSTSLDDKDIMMASLILWTSEHRRIVASREMGVEKARVIMFMIPDDSARPDYMFQPMEAVLTLGYLY